MRHDEVDRRQRQKRLLSVVAALALLVTGIVIGSRISPPQEAAPRVDATTALPSTRPAPSRPVPTPSGAVAAAARSITAFDGDVLLDSAQLRSVVERIAAAPSRAALIDAFDQASVQTRAKLGADNTPEPAIVLRSVPVGYRVEQFSTGTARVAVWYVGIVGSEATVLPQQSWRTQIVNLLWDGGSWKVRSFESTVGPTPPLSSIGIDDPAELFAAVARFEAFERAEP